MDNYVSYSDATELMTAIANKINNSGFITNTVNNLVNYYLKTETYSKTEVDALLQAIATLDIQAVSQLPTTNISTTTIYLVPKQDPQVPDVKDEYINLDGTTSGWELIGNTQIDLSNYVTTSDLTTALQSYATKAYVDGLTFVGTQAQWNALTTAQKKTYKYASFTDDYSDNPVGNLNALNTTDKSSCVGAITEVNSKIGIKLKSFDVSVPSGASSYNFENEKPSDFGGIVGAFAVGSGANISVGRVRNSEIIFNSAISANASLRILYSAT
jgi:hypothetical protein